MLEREKERKKLETRCSTRKTRTGLHTAIPACLDSPRVLLSYELGFVTHRHAHQTEPDLPDVAYDGDGNLQAQTVWVAMVMCDDVIYRYKYNARYDGNASMDVSF